MRKALALATVTLITLMIAACGIDHETSPYGVDCADLGESFSQCTITMTDTRRVTCIASNAQLGAGLDCDWNHVDGADNL